VREFGKSEEFKYMIACNLMMGGKAKIVNFGESGTYGIKITMPSDRTLMYVTRSNSNARSLLRCATRIVKNLE
jgi:hypothetical protein